MTVRTAHAVLGLGGASVTRLRIPRQQTTPATIFDCNFAYETHFFDEFLEVHPMSRPSLYTSALALAQLIVRMLGSARHFTHGLWFAFFSASCTVTQALRWPWQCLLLGAALTLLCLTSSSFLRSGGRSAFGVFWMFCAAIVGCSAIFLLREMGFDNSVTAGPICAFACVLFTAVKAWRVRPDSMHSAVATTAAGLRGAAGGP